MSLISVDWQSHYVAVACPVGPEQPPAVILPSGNARLSGGLVFDINGSAQLEWVESSVASQNIVAVVNAVIDVIQCGLNIDKVWLRPGGQAMLKQRESNGQFVLVIGDNEWAAKDILRRYSILLKSEIESVIERTPRLIAIIEDPPEDVACVVGTGMSARSLKVVQEVLSDAGFRAVEFVDRWAAAAAWRLGREELSSSCLVIDWAHDALYAAVCAPRESDARSVKPTTLCRLNATSNSSIRRRIVEHLRSGGSLEVVAADRPDWSNPPPDPKPQVTPDALEKAAADLTRQILLGYGETKAEVELMDDRPFEVRYGLKNDSAARSRMPVEMDKAVTASLLHEPLRRIRNGLANLRLRHERSLPAKVCAFGSGLFLPGAADVMREVFGDELQSLRAEEALSAPAKGALLIARGEKPNRLPYDCGLLLVLEGPQDPNPMGTLVLRRGQTLPCQASSKEFLLAWRDGKPLGVSIYLRKPDFGQGRVIYTIHGLYSFVPATDIAGRFHLRADISVDADCRIDVTIVDLIARQELTLEQMGIFGGTRLLSPPFRKANPAELNGGLCRRMFELFRERHKERGFGGVKREEFSEFLDRNIHTGGPPQRDDPRMMSRESLALSLPDVIDEEMVDSERHALSSVLDDMTVSNDAISLACRNYLSVLLINVALGLVRFVEDNRSGKLTKGLQRLKDDATRLKTHPPPLGPKEFRELPNHITRVINQLELDSASSDLRIFGQETEGLIEEVKEFVQRLTALYARAEHVQS